MSFVFDIHNNFTREMIKIYRDRIAGLFQQGEFKAFSLDNTINKMALLRVSALANALPPAWQEILKAAGIGESVHAPGGHFGFNEFQLDQLAAIFTADRGLTPAKES